MVLCASQPLAGQTYTHFPRKVVYLVYVLIFEIGNLVCALAPSSGSLIAGRAVTGSGASGISTSGFFILTTTIPLNKRALWTGTFSSTFAIASIVGPVRGGAFTQNVSWRWYGSLAMMPSEQSVYVSTGASTLIPSWICIARVPPRRMQPYARKIIPTMWTRYSSVEGLRLTLQSRQ
jgi:MFS family permease